MKEGGPQPLVKRERYWEAVFVEALRQAAGRKPVCQSIAIHPDGTRQLLPRWWGQDALNPDDDDA
jgi:hypothetical protein